MRRLILTGLSVLNIFFACSQSTYIASNKVEVKNEGMRLSKLVLILPYPETNNYQTVEWINFISGEIKESANTGNKYLREIKTEYLPGGGQSHSLSYDMNITLYPMLIDTKQFNTIYPYDTNSSLYRKYTTSKGNYIDLNNANIQSKADQLWNDTKGNLIDYAYACYLYASGFNYLNPLTGIHPIAKILYDAGGDCGNLSSIFINLLRIKGIPARHIVMVRPDGSYHVTADFYLEKYGWIPVDVTMKHDYPSGDYFGYHAGDGIVMSFDICSLIEYDPAFASSEAVILQSYYWWYWFVGTELISARHKLSSQLIGSPAKPVLKSVESRQATLQYEAYKGATHYYVSLYKNGMSIPEKEYTFNRSDREFTIDNLSPSTNYIIKITTCRNVDNIETTMSYSSLNFTTSELPTANETIANNRITCSNNTLRINTPASERISIYSPSGAQLFSAQKPSGEVDYNLSDMSGKVVIISGSSGWNYKLKISK
jgi:hypothetical protein